MPTFGGAQGGVFESLPIDQVELDFENPRIRRFLEVHDGVPNAAQIALALGAGVGDDDDTSGPTFEKLRNSIITNGGIIQPIIVNRRADNTLVCIEGNTRLALYRAFREEKVTGNWDEIPALVYSNMDKSKADSVRLQIHLVGTRQWDPYSKAKYLFRLRNEELMPFSEIVDYCGGRTSEITELIQAYSDMEQHYRPIIPDDGMFDVKKFSGFVELQRIKKRLADHNYTAADSAKWILEGKFSPLYTVRSMPRILDNPKAMQVFFTDGAKEAIKIVETPVTTNGESLENASLQQLARALSNKIYNISFVEAKQILNDPSCESARAINEAQMAITEFFNS